MAKLLLRKLLQTNSTTTAAKVSVLWKWLMMKLHVLQSAHCMTQTFKNAKLLLMNLPHALKVKEEKAAAAADLRNAALAAAVAAEVVAAAVVDMAAAAVVVAVAAVDMVAAVVVTVETAAAVADTTGINHINSNQNNSIPQSLRDFLFSKQHNDLISV
jgi:hypothetical protein